MRKVLITGAEGFVAHYLINELKKDFQLLGTYYIEKDLDIESIFLDITNYDKAEKIIKNYKPDIIYHLAAQSSGGSSLKEPYLTYNINVLGTLNMFEIIRKLKFDIKIFIPSSSDVYGNPQYLPVDEKHPLYAGNPYASSKILIEKIAEQYKMHYNLKIIMTRSFNHTGVFQDERFFIPSMINQIKKAKNGDTIYTGNIDIKRDFLDVRDVIRAYKELINIDNGIYNVCSGKSYTLRDIINQIIKISGKNINIKIDNERLRKYDIEEMKGTYDLIKNDLGWEPKIDIKETLKWMYESNE